MTRRRVAILVDRPPRERLSTREDADLILATLALDQLVTVAFVGDGVYHCCEPDLRPENDPSAVFGSLHLYDVDRLLVEQESLALRGLAGVPLRFDVEPLPRARLSVLLRSRDLLL